MLLLTKPLGTGLLVSGRRRGLTSDADLGAAVDSMRRLNRAAAEVLVEHGVRGATDVTGFGLLGHGLEMARASGTRFVFDAGALPALDGALDLAGAGVETGGATHNRRFVAPALAVDPGVERVRDHARPRPADVRGPPRRRVDRQRRFDRDRAQRGRRRELADRSRRGGARRKPGARVTLRSRPLVLALAAAVVLFVALSKETWLAIPIVAGVGVLLLARGNHLGRGPTVAALVLVASLAFVVFGSVITLLSVSARAMASLVFASGMTAIVLGVTGLVVSVIQLRRVMRSTPSKRGAPSEPVSSP